MLFKEAKQFDSWQRSTLAQARAQDVADILDPTCVPSTPSDKELFAEKQKHMFAVFERTLLTDVGKSLVRDHEDDGDAREVYKAVVAYYLKSTKASLDSADLLSYITSIRLGSGLWKGPTHSFILHWQDQVRMYEKQVSVSDHFSSDQKCIMLQNAVHPVTDLRNVKNQADQLKTHTGIAPTYEQYCNLLLSAASNYDASYTAKEAPSLRSRSRAVYMHDLKDSEFYDAEVMDTSSEPTYDIDVSIGTLQAYAHQQRTQPKQSPATFGLSPSRMTRDKWMKLTPEARQIWDQLDDHSKAVILAPAGKHTTNGTRKINLHEISAYDYLLANAHSSSEHTSPDPDTQVDTSISELSPPEATDVNNQVLINAAKQSKSTQNPADIRQVLSNTMARPPGTASQKPDEIVLNGKTYRQVHLHNTYSVSAS